MFTLALIFLLQSATLPQGEIVGPYTFREDTDQTTKVVLKNGLTVIVREQLAVPLASITTHVKAGYFDEEDRISGISHVLEHMFFKGTPTRGPGDLARETKALGGTLNAYTYYDRTVYYTVVPAENLTAALDIQADALWRSTFDAGELGREIEVVLQENSRKLDNPSAVAAEKLYATAFEQHRMKRWRIGTPEGLRALTRDDVVAYHQKYYQPSNIILTVVGQFERERILDEIVKLYGDVENVPVERDLSPPEPAQTAARYASERGPIEQTHLAIGFHGPGFLSEDARALEVLAAIIGSGRASRLIQNLRDQRHLIADGSAGLQAFRDLGFFEVTVETSSPADARIALIAELESIRRAGVSAEAVARAKMSIAQDYLHRQETVDGVGDDLALFEAFGDWKKSAEYLSEIEQVTPERVAAAAQKYLDFEALNAFEYVPESAPAAGQGFSAAVLNAASGIADQRIEELKVEELPVAARIPTFAPGIVDEIVGTVQRRSILRGPDVYILEDHRLPLVSFGIFYPGGRLYESANNAGINELMLRTALRGTRRFDAAAIARRLENAGARIEVVNEPDFFGYIVNGVSGQMDEALEVLMDVLQQPLFEAEQIVNEKALQLERIRNLQDDNFTYPVSLFMQSLFGDHAYARTALGTAEALAGITNTDVMQWFRANERMIKPTIVIVGDTNGTGLVAPLTEALTNEDLETRDLSVLPAVQAAAGTRERVETENRRQTALVYGFPGARHASTDRYTLEVFANIVSGLGGRLFDAIREKQGLAYTVRTSNAFNAKGGAVYTYTAFSPENEQDVRATLDLEFEKLRSDGVTAEELSKAISTSVGISEMRLQTREARTLEYARAVFSGAGTAAVARYGEGLRSVTLDRVQAAMQQYLDPSGLRIGILRATP